MKNAIRTLLIAVLALCCVRVQAANYPVIRSRGPEYRAVKMLMVARGYNPGSTDENITYASQTAIRSFQRANRLSQDGIPGPATLTRAVKTVRFGEHSNYVRAMQVLLNKFGSNLSVDGQFGSGTRSALIRVQGQLGLSRDGICGPASWKALFGTPGSTSSGGSSSSVSSSSASLDSYVREVQNNFDKFKNRKSTWTHKCGSLVFWQLWAKGLVYESESNTAYGKDMARFFARKGRTTRGYATHGYACSKSNSASVLRNIIQSRGGRAENIIISFDGGKGGLSNAGHVMMIYKAAPVNGRTYCFFVDNTRVCSTGSGYRAISLTLDEYISRYLNVFSANYMTVVG